jgi:hypothetical protein
MPEFCPLKHSKASDCHHARFPGGKLDLAHYSRMHPPKGDVNFHEELNAAAHAAPRKSFTASGPKTDKFSWDFKGY